MDAKKGREEDVSSNSPRQGDSADLIREYGIHRVRCSLPLPAATINVYFVREPVPTIIDAPPEGERYIEELDCGLRSVGSSVDDIKRIIITHPHFDHYGSAERISNRSGAEIWVFAGGAHWLEQYEEEFDRHHAYLRTLLTKSGVHAPDVDYVMKYYRDGSCFGHRAKVSRHLAEGDTFRLGTAIFTVNHIPGHTPFCILLHDTANRLAFTGDFVPPDLPGLPLVQWTDIRSEGYRKTGSYISSLKKVRAMNLRIALPGHGPVIEDPSDRIEGLLDLIERRKAAVLRVLYGGGKTPFQIAQEIFPPQFPRESLFRTVPEVMGQLELLEDAGIVTRREGEPLFFTRAT